MIPFSPPRIDQKILDEVSSALKSGWITTGPRTKEFEKRISAYTNAPATLCLNSATAGLEVMLRWFGVGPGDEVILPAYTYSATANVIIHVGAKPVFVDVNKQDFNINVEEIEKKISTRTKVIMPVDFGGMPCDYELIMNLVNKYAKLFCPNSEQQEKLKRILVLSDAAHSFGAKYKNQKTGVLADVTVFSFHAVKNLTTAEGGAVCLNLPLPFDNQELYRLLCIKTLHGQTKDALAKTQKGNWRYDIVEAGYKCNMTDIAAAIGLIELDRYDNDTLIKRRSIFEMYCNFLKINPMIELPLYESAEKTSSFHLFPIRIKGIDENKRDLIIQKIFDADVSVNVHFIPVPCMTFYKNMGYSIQDYPVTYDNFSREISLPVFYDLTAENCKLVCDAVLNAIQEVLKN